MRRKAVVEVDTNYDHYTRSMTMFIFWRGQDGEQYGYSLGIPEGAVPAYMQEPPPPPQPKSEPKSDSLLTEGDRIWIASQMALTRPDIYDRL